MRRGLLVLALTLTLCACGYDGSYRYECQDPANWNAEECNPPMCLVDGMCTENLIGFDPKEYDGSTVTTSDTVPVSPEETTAP
jgi:hypothetical protein